MALVGRAFLDFDKQTLWQKRGGWHLFMPAFLPYMTLPGDISKSPIHSVLAWHHSTELWLKMYKVLKTSEKIVLNTCCFLAIMIQCLSLVSYQFKTQQRSLLPTKQQKQNETRICYIHQGSIKDFLFRGGSLSWKSFEPRDDEKTIFRPSRGVRGHALQEKFENIVFRIGWNRISVHW